MLKNPERSPLWDTKFQAEAHKGLEIARLQCLGHSLSTRDFAPEASERQVCEPRARVFHK